MGPWRGEGGKVPHGELCAAAHPSLSVQKQKGASITEHPSGITIYTAATSQPSDTALAPSVAPCAPRDPLAQPHTLQGHLVQVRVVLSPWASPWGDPHLPPFASLLLAAEPQQGAHDGLCQRDDAHGLSLCRQRTAASAPWTPSSHSWLDETLLIPVELGQNPLACSRAGAAMWRRGMAEQRAGLNQARQPWIMGKGGHNLPKEGC